MSFCRSFLLLKKVKLVRMAKRKIRKRQKRAINLKRIKGKIVKNQILLKQGMISLQRFSPQWRNIKKSSLLLGYILYKQLQV